MPPRVCTAGARRFTRAIRPGSCSFAKRRHRRHQHQPLAVAASPLAAVAAATTAAAVTSAMATQPATSTSGAGLWLGARLLERDAPAATRALRTSASAAGAAATADGPPPSSVVLRHLARLSRSIVRASTRQAGPMPRSKKTNGATSCSPILTDPAPTITPSVSTHLTTTGIALTTDPGGARAATPLFALRPQHR